MTRRTACGTTTWRRRLQVREPERASGRGLARVHRLDSGPVHLGDVCGVDDDERDRSPEQGRDGHSLDLKSWDAETEDVDDENGRDTSEEIHVDHCERAQREEHRSREAPQNRDPEGEDEDEHLGDQEDLHVRPERREDVRERLLELVAIEERLLDLVPPGRADDEHDHHGHEGERRQKGNGDAAAAAALRQAAEDSRAAVSVQCATSGSERRSSRAISARADGASRWCGVP